MTKTAVELADALDWSGMRGGIPEIDWPSVREAATLLRQQAAEIEGLKARALQELPQGFHVQMLVQHNFGQPSHCWEAWVQKTKARHQDETRAECATGTTPAAAVQAALDKVGG